MELLSETTERKCIECGEKVIGRADKKYCGEWCKSAHNNKVKMAAQKATPDCIAAIQRTILHNHQILSRLWSWGRYAVSRITLEEMGFNFSFITSIREDSGATCCYCFNIGYTVMDDEVLLMHHAELSA